MTKAITTGELPHRDVHLPPHLSGAGTPAGGPAPGRSPARSLLRPPQPPGPLALVPLGRSGPYAPSTTWPAREWREDALSTGEGGSAPGPTFWRHSCSSPPGRRRQSAPGGFGTGWTGIRPPRWPGANVRSRRALEVQGDDRRSSHGLRRPPRCPRLPPCSPRPRGSVPVAPGSLGLPARPHARPPAQRFHRLAPARLRPSPAAPARPASHPKTTSLETPPGSRLCGAGPAGATLPHPSRGTRPPGRGDPPHTWGGHLWWQPVRLSTRFERTCFPKENQGFGSLSLTVGGSAASRGKCPVPRAPSLLETGVQRGAAVGIQRGRRASVESRPVGRLRLRPLGGAAQSRGFLCSPPSGEGKPLPGPGRLAAGGPRCSLRAPPSTSVRRARSLHPVLGRR